MNDPRAITPDGFEILVVRELRKAGVEPLGVHRQALHTDELGFVFELVGRLVCYGHKWRALIACSNRMTPISANDVSALHERVQDIHIPSALLCTTALISAAAIARGSELRVPLLRVVDARLALQEAGMILPGQLPAWVPEFTLEIVTNDGAGRLLEANQPELILRELRASGSS